MAKNNLRNVFKKNKRSSLRDRKQDILTIFMKDQFEKILRFGEMPISLYTK